jgi:hypothetical protein
MLAFMNRVDGRLKQVETQVNKMLTFVQQFHLIHPGVDPEFQVRGGALRKIAPSRGRLENFWGISCENSRFYAKKSYFFNYRGR